MLHRICFEVKKKEEKKTQKEKRTESNRERAQKSGGEQKSFCNSMFSSLLFFSSFSAFSFFRKKDFLCFLSFFYFLHFLIRFFFEDIQFLDQLIPLHICLWENWLAGCMFSLHFSISLLSLFCFSFSLDLFFHVFFYCPYFMF